jgi:protoporphyrinogen oxidase
MKIAVIGAGPAGMTAAYKLSESLGNKVTDLDIYELSTQVGGLSRSIDLWDQRVDLGPHRFFSHDTSINEVWLEVVGKDYDIVNRQTRIYYKKRFFDYPIRALNALKGLGLLEAARCMLSYLGERLVPTRDTSTFEGWVTSRFGETAFHHLF